MTWWKRAAAQREAALDDMARAVLIQEHSSLREEILASYGYAQSIVRWTLATFAAILAAGLILVHDGRGGTESPLFITIALIIFGLAVPGIVWLNSWGWLGELYRAERAGSYLRAVERDIASVEGLTARLGFEPARWETFIAANRASRGLWGKQVMTYLGTAGVFFGAAVASEAVFFLVLIESGHVSALVQGAPPWLWPAGSLCLHALGIAFAFAIFRRLMLLGAADAPVRRTYGQGRAT